MFEPQLDPDDTGLEGYIARERPEPARAYCAECYRRNPMTKDERHG
jgi:hypothetical protein